MTGVGEIKKQTKKKGYNRDLKKTDLIKRKKKKAQKNEKENKRKKTREKSLCSWVLSPRPARRDRFMGTLNHHNTYLMTRVGSTLNIISFKTMNS